MSEIRKVDATTWLTVDCDCPWCDQQINVLEQVREHFSSNELSIDYCEIEITCTECKNEFEITCIHY